MTNENASPMSDAKLAAEARRKKILERGSKRMSMVKGEVTSLTDDMADLDVSGSGNVDGSGVATTPTSASGGRRRRNRGSVRVSTPSVETAAAAAGLELDTQRQGLGEAEGAASSSSASSSSTMREAMRESSSPSSSAATSAAPSAATTPASTNPNTPSKKSGRGVEDEEEDPEAAAAAKAERRRVREEKLRQIEEDVSLNTAASDAEIVRNGLKGAKRGRGAKGAVTAAGADDSAEQITSLKGQPRDFVAVFRLFAIVLVAMWLPFSSVSLGIFATQFVSGFALKWWNNRNRLVPVESKGWLAWVMWFFDKGVTNIVLEYVLTTASEASVYILVRSLRAGIPDLNTAYVHDVVDDSAVYASMADDGAMVDGGDEFLGDIGSLGEL